MADEQVVRLLEEIRDLQKQQLENYKQVITGQQQALANQQQALETQKQVVRRSKVVLVAIGVIVLVLFRITYILVGNKLGFALPATAVTIPEDFLRHYPRCFLLCSNSILSCRVIRRYRGLPTQ